MINRDQPNGSIIGSGTMAYKGIAFRALNANSDYRRSWIVDSGASDHMTGNRNIL